MVKTIFKEIGIVILLLIAVGLVLAIMFYDYIPSNKTVPAKIQAYNFPEDIKEELKKSIEAEQQNIVRTYYIDSSDLDLYEATNDYDKGKANPFADYTTNTSNTTNNSTNGGTNVNTSNNNTNNSSKQENSTDRNEVYINTPGKNY